MPRAREDYRALSAEGPGVAIREARAARAIGLRGGTNICKTGSSADQVTSRCKQVSAIAHGRYAIIQTSPPNGHRARDTMTMTMITDLRSLTKVQRNTFLAGFLGWTFDAFDFFVLVFILRPLAEEFGASVKELTLAIVLTLAA